MEDDTSIREISVKLLSMTGYKTLEADTRDLALEIIKKQKGISTVLLDITMPGMTVEDFLEKISNYQRPINVIFSSGQPEDIVQRYLKKSCNYRFLSKPYGMKELKEVLDHSDCEKNHQMNPYQVCEDI